MKIIDKFVLKYVKKNDKLRNDIVLDWSKGAEIATYNIRDSEVTLSNVCLISSSIIGCRMSNVTNSIFEDSQLHFTIDDSK